MKHVTLAEARAKTAELFEEIEQGEVLTISKLGVPAQSPRFNESRRQEIRAAIDGILELRKQTKPVTIEEIITWKNEGRA